MAAAPHRRVAKFHCLAEKFIKNGDWEEVNFLKKHYINGKRFNLLIFKMNLISVATEAVTAATMPTTTTTTTMTWVTPQLPTYRCAPNLESNPSVAGPLVILTTLLIFLLAIYVLMRNFFHSIPRRGDATRYTAAATTTMNTRI